MPFAVEHRENHGPSRKSSFHRKLMHEQLKLTFGEAKDRPKRQIGIKISTPTFVSTPINTTSSSQSGLASKKSRAKTPSKTRPLPPAQEGRTAPKLVESCLRVTGRTHQRIRIR